MNSNQNKIDIWQHLLPGLCLNRFYVADGVNTIAIEIWFKFINTIGGKKLISYYINDIIDYYIVMSKASNHMVSEAALLGINELLLRINKKYILPKINNIFGNIIICLNSDSWPVVDSATICSGNLIRNYAKKCEKKLLFFFGSWTSSSRSTIWSVRENSSIAFCDALKTTDLDIKLIILNFITNYLDKNLLSAKNEDVFGVKKSQFIPMNMMKMMKINEKKNLQNTKNNPNDISHGNNDENIETIYNGKKQKNGFWGCCLDCLEVRRCSFWEISDGCIYLIRELASTHPEVALNYLPKIYELLKLEHFKNFQKLHTTIFNQVT